MRIPTFLLLLLPLTATATATVTAKSFDPVADPSTDRKLNATLEANFPGSPNGLGVKLVNGVPTLVVLRLRNHEDAPLTVESVGGALLDPADRNVTLAPLPSRKVPAGTVGLAEADESVEVAYEFVNEMNPRLVLLQLTLAVRFRGERVNVLAFNGTAEVVEAPASLLDPQLLFLYLILATMSLYSGYFVYNTWLASVLPNTRRTSSDTVRVVRPVEAAPRVAGKYDESWIPEHHIKKPVPVRGKTGVRSRKGGE